YDGRAVKVNAGQLIKITDVEGQQVGDMFAIVRDEPTMYLDTFRSRTGNRKLFPVPGEQFVTLEREPILTFLSDHSPGVHDMLYATCDYSTYKRQGFDDHPTCNQNFLDAVSEAGIEGYRWAPGPVNIFQNSTIAPDRKTIETAPTLTKAGDFLEFRAEKDIWLVLTACSYDIGEFIGGKSKPLQIEVFDAPAESTD
ncbi:MAG: urea carboxylase-associated family protein, partial [Bryobacterales bacterium]